MKKNQKIELTIDSLTSEGSGIGRYNGFAVFVFGTVPGDRIIAHIIKVSKNYAVGILHCVLEPSPSRTESPCPVFMKCGGCSFQHMTYEEELLYKKQRVQDALVRIGHLNIETEGIIGAHRLTGYRNKAQYPVKILNGELQTGFYAHKSHRIIPCRDCLLQPKEFEQGIEAFAHWVRKTQVTSYDEANGRGLLRHIYFRKAFGTGQIMACAVINGDSIPAPDILTRVLLENLPNLKSVILNINKAKTNVVLGDRYITLWGSDSITDLLLDRQFVISPNSFYQVNHSQCRRLYQTAKDFAALRGDETLLDLYCGAGTIGITMADRVKELIGIEVIEQAVENARENARLNHVENARFICADAYRGAELLEKENIHPDVVILDPPRKGCEGALIDVLHQMNPERIVYISCNCATLARDLALFAQKDFCVKRVVAVDMFPRTPHVETICLLSKLHAKQHIEVEGCQSATVSDGEGEGNYGGVEVLWDDLRSQIGIICVPVSSTWIFVFISSESIQPKSM